MRASSLEDVHSALDIVVAFLQKLAQCPRATADVEDTFARRVLERIPQRNVDVFVNHYFKTAGVSADFSREALQLRSLRTSSS